MTLQRKLKKLLRDPRQFIEDMRLKRVRNLTSLAPKKAEGHSRYAVVSAVYNVDLYLDQYFQSMVDQRLDFKNNITLIMVDDGSTDDSAEIIKRWQRRYPKNIVYLYKVNGGQASARNLGLEHVQTDWVTFVDPDDFLDLNYFLEIDKFLAKNDKSNLKLISSNFIFFYEEKGQFSDSHPLKYRFEKGDSIFSYDNFNKLIQLSASAAFFKLEVISSNSLNFDLKIKPNFEDAHFVGAYLSELVDGYIGVCSQAKYFYRKRANNTSTLDSTWENQGTYGRVLEYGYLDLFHIYKNKFKSIPKHIQRTVLYALVWHVKYLTNHPERCKLQAEGEVSRYLQLLDQVFECIDLETILEFELAGCWFFHKVGMLGAFKQSAPPFQYVYVEDYDPAKSLVQLRYFTSVVGLEVFEIDGQDVIPAFSKTVRHDFLDRTFALERRIWLPIPAGSTHAKLKVEVSQVKTRLSLAKKMHNECLELQQIRRHFIAKQREYDRVQAHPQDALWVLMDRDTQADDNAEHFYRYVQREHPEQSIAFALRRDSHDWPRLEQEGFNLLAFGSAEHEAALRTCSKIIGSDAVQYVVDYFQDQSLHKKPFVFLQHGVTKDDLSGWLNTKQRIDCFVTSAQPEYESIANDFNRYKFTRKEVALTGFPRHDALLNAAQATERMILIMPTWRKYLLGEVTSGGRRAPNADFMQTEYAHAWQALLQSSQLRELVEQHEYRVVFFPHVLIQPYLVDFNLPQYIEVLAHGDSSIQQLFQRAAVMITDYSSVAFEMALLQKPVIYYQFDEAIFFQGDHSYQKGYFDYRRDGFGPVVVQEEELLRILSDTLELDAQPTAEYLARMNAFFPFRDGRNCERVFQAVVELDKPLPEGWVDLACLESYAKEASHAGQGSLAKKRWSRYLDCLAKDGTSVQLLHAQMEFAIALGELGLPVEAAQCLDRVKESIHQEPQLIHKVLIEEGKLHMMLEEWAQALHIWEGLRADPDTQSNRQICMAQAGWVDALKSELDSAANDSQLSVEHQVLLAIANRDWAEVVGILGESPDELDSSCTANALLIRAFREQGLLENGQMHLIEYQSRYGKDRSWLIESAKYAAINAEWSQVVTNLNAAYTEGVLAMPLNDALLYLQSLRFTGLHDKANDAHEVLFERYPLSIELAAERGENAIASRSWRVAEQTWSKLCTIRPDAPFKLAMSLRFLGDFEEAFSVLGSEDLSKSRSSDEWKLLAELAEIKEQYSVAEKAWKALLEAYPDKSPAFTIDRLNFSRLMLSLKRKPLEN